MATSWEKKRLGDLAIIIMGQSPKSEYYNNRGDGLPFFQGNRDFGELHPSPSTYCSLPSKIALPKDILMSVRAPVGALNIATEECCIGRGLCAIRPNRSGQFIFYLLKGNTENIHAAESGAVFGAVNKADLNNLLLLVPSDEQTQDKIAAILSAYDDLIEKNLRRIKILEEMAQSIYREWFVKFRFPGHQKVKMVDSPLGKIPEKWEVKNLFEVADVTYGFPFKSSRFNVNREGIAVVRIRDVLDGQSTTFTKEDAPDKYIVHDGDFLVGMDGDFHMGFWAGGTAFLVQRVARFRPRRDVGRYFLALALKEPIKHFNKTITGTTVSHLGDSHLRTLIQR